MYGTAIKSNKKKSNHLYFRLQGP